MAEFTEVIKGKVCTKCSTFREMEEFTKNSSSRDGRYSICRPCKNVGKRKTPPAPEGMRHCGACETVKPLEEFRRATANGYGKAQCIPCENNYRKEWVRRRAESDPAWAARRKQRERERKTPEEKAEYYLHKFYGISLKRYNEMLAEQEGVCYLCKRPETYVGPSSGNTKRLSVDHDHSCCPGTVTCGQCIRGLLCAKCNSTLGWVEKLSLERIGEYVVRRAY